jgi:hypothetical protein
MVLKLGHLWKKRSEISGEVLLCGVGAGCWTKHVKNE